MKYILIVDKQSRLNPSTEKKEYILDIEELRTNGNVSDELIISLNETFVMRRLSLSEYHVLEVLKTPIKEMISDPKIELFKGDNYIYLVDMVGNKFYAEYLIRTDFNEIFMTKKETNAVLEQSAQQIIISVNEKLTNYSTTQEMNATLNIKAGEIMSNVSKEYETKENANKEYSEIKQTTQEINQKVEKKVDDETITGAYLILKINGDTSETKLNADKIELSAQDVLNLLAGNTINLSTQNIVIDSDSFQVTKNGYVKVRGSSSNSDLFRVETLDGNVFAYIQPMGAGFVDRNGDGRVYITAGDISSIDLYGTNGTTELRNTGITTPVLTQTSLETIKKNIQETQINALELIKNSNIYEYNLKSEQDTDKKRYGFVIGDKYNTPTEVISKDKQGIDTYSMCSIVWKALQEQLLINEKLEKRVCQLKQEVSNGQN